MVEAVQSSALYAMNVSKTDQADKECLSQWGSGSSPLLDKGELSQVRVKQGWSAGLPAMLLLMALHSFTAASMGIKVGERRQETDAREDYSKAKLQYCISGR